MLNLLGQSRAVSQLQQSLAAGRLAHTLMFAGPTGVGKFTLAVELAKTVMCDKPIHRENRGEVPSLPKSFQLTLPCEKCDSCRAIAAGSHPDLHIITKELIRYHDKAGTSKGTTMSIQVIRGEITGDPESGKEAKISKRPVRGRGKFFIIDQADLMETGAQNSLLKTLEEPPPHSFLILITASPQDLLWTIRSRSQIVQFSELPEKIIRDALKKSTLTAEDAALMARIARGSLGLALRWAGDISRIDEKNAQAAERRAKKAERSGDSDEDAADKFTPNGILTWVRELGEKLDEFVAGRQSASDVAAIIAKYAAEYAELALLHDRLTSADRAKRDGIALLMSFAADWFTDRMRHGLGVPHETSLPGKTGALDYGIVPDLVAAARAAEWQVDMNAHDKTLLAATTTQWELLLRK